MNFLKTLLASGPTIALAGHAITAGLAYASGRGWIPPDALGAIGTIAGLVVNASASAARSTTAAAVKKLDGAPGLKVIPADATWNDPNAR